MKFVVGPGEPPGGKGELDGDGNVDVAGCRSLVRPRDGDAIDDRHGRALLVCLSGRSVVGWNLGRLDCEASDCHHFYGAGTGRVRCGQVAEDTQSDRPRTVACEGGDWWSGRRDCGGRSERV